MYGGYDAGASQFAGGGFMPRSGFVFPKAAARPVHLMLKSSFVCCSPANGADVGSSPAQAVRMTFLIWFNTDLTADLDRPQLCTAEVKRKRADIESTYSQANL